jgi:hypothetical protein
MPYMRHVRFIVAFLAVCICGDIIPGLSRISQSYQAKDAQGPQPLWEIDLSKFGYEARLKELPDKTYPHPVSWGTRQTLVFTQENVLATTFEVHIEDGAPSVRDKNLPTDPYHMAVLFLTAGSGAVIRKGDWPVHSSTRTWFFAAQDGQSILGIGNKLTLLSPELTKISELTLPTPYGELTMALASPAADTLLVLYGGGPEFKYASKLDLLDTADLSLLKFWTGEEARPNGLYGETSWLGSPITIFALRRRLQDPGKCWPLRI